MTGDKKRVTGYVFPFSDAGAQVNMTYNFSATQNKGRIVSSADGVTGENVSYTYDSLNRLIAAATTNTTGVQWNESYSFDGFGNLTSKVPTKGTAPQVYPQVNSATNQARMSGDYGFDANGNWMGSGGSQINTWNVENQLISNGAVDGSGNLLTYTYDPWGKRVLQYSVCARCSQGSGTLYFYSISGQRLGSYQLNDYPPGYGGIIVLTPMYIPQYFGRRMLVAMDRLGSVRNSQNGSMAYYPWGEEELQSNGTTTPDGTDKFGTYFRDSSVAGVGQDYANARYYNNNFGRFWSSDPGGIATADQKNPQSWNRYAYVNDDPVNGYDPTGKDVVLIFDPGSFWSPTPTAMSICMINPGACSPWGTGPEGVSATADGGGGGVSFGAAQAIFQKGAAKIATMNFSSKCSTDLAAVGTTATAVQADATYLANPANSNAIQNGAVSTVLESSLWANTLGYNGAVADFGNMTIGQYMAQNAGTVAEAQLNGNTIYINPSLINSGPSNYYFNTATVLHEVLHNVTGLGDPAVQTDLGLPVSKDTSNITNRLIADCF